MYNLILTLTDPQQEKTLLTLPVDVQSEIDRRDARITAAIALRDSRIKAAKANEAVIADAKAQCAAMIQTCVRDYLSVSAGLILAEVEKTRRLIGKSAADLQAESARSASILSQIAQMPLGQVEQLLQ